VRSSSCVVWHQAPPAAAPGLEGAAVVAAHCPTRSAVRHGAADGATATMPGVAASSRLTISISSAGRCQVHGCTSARRGDDERAQLSERLFCRWHDVQRSWHPWKALALGRLAAAQQAVRGSWKITGLFTIRTD
jgi:hypothetical protein